ncbi:ATP-binding cassette domain-containing protein [Enterobacteriaceae endosymbiont of Plateumaris consimilis]|uniref:ATP-binding cassette domain-containing protein n=1 Tax=Enterobacteriaceae endosymbiont of Plateumaris consimilis TaxID=2675794 RepID=UPI0014499B0B|nr:ATP-binding cassette domain-containing protein [Enterobacteriaceae endosymbiont of Plateumaris consimilis]QJC28841.1 ATP-binding cassette domain-containing protein [Enterobacteriaceae endosymbiont of Plateumaris consimilis]
MFYLLYFFKNHKKYVKILCFGILLTIITNLMSISLSVISGWLLTSTFLFKFIVNSINYNYIVPSAIIRIISIIKTVAKYFEKIIKHDSTLKVLKNLRKMIFCKIFPLYPSNLQHLNNSDILNTLISDIETLDHLYIQILSPIISLFITIIIILINLSFFSFKLSIIICLILFFSLLIHSIYFYNLGKSIGKNNIYYRNKYYFYISNYLYYQTEYRIFEGINMIRKKIHFLEIQWQKIQCKKNNYNAQSQSIMIIINGINIITLLIYSNFYLSNNLNSKFYIISFLLCLITLSNMLLSISNIFHNISEVLLSAKKIFMIINQKPIIKFTKQKNFFTKKNSNIIINIDNISFSYPQQPLLILKNLSLLIKYNEKIAITGHNGCGKSTLLMLLTRAWDPIKGIIYLNNINLKLLDSSILRQNISVINQRIYLFSDTLKNNLLLNNQNNCNINYEFLIKIIRLVGLNKLIDNNNKGLELWMGEGGRSLSGGELKRLAIARAILHNGNLILLDEPTEGLDNITSYNILKLIFSIFKKKTIVIITHNINIIKKMDLIYFMDNGCFIEKGHHNDLVNKKGKYWNYIKNNIINDKKTFKY